MSMIEIRVHGRGGMGSITFTEVLAKAAGYEDKFVQAFGSFGTERRGSPVKAFCRLDDKKILVRTQIYKPDYVVVLDESLLKLPETVEGAKPGTVFIVNTGKKSIDGLKNKSHVFDATSLALEVIGKDIVNTAMLGAFAKATGLVKLESLLKMIDERFQGKMAELNRKLVSDAYNNMQV